MTVAELEDYLHNFPPDTKVELTEAGSTIKRELVLDDLEYQDHTVVIVL